VVKSVLGRCLSIFIVASTLVPVASRAAACDFKVSPTTTHSVELLLENRPASLVDQLERTGLAFAPANAGSGCDGFAHALVHFEQPRDKVLKLLSQTARQDEFLSHHVVSVRRDEDESLDEHRMRVLFTNVTYRVQNSWSRSDWQIVWHLDPSYDNSLRMLRGYWYLHDYEGGTLGVYGSKVNVGPMFPMTLQAALTSKKLRRVVAHFRQWVDSDGSYRP
jgi:hypothetical protein